MNEKPTAEIRPPEISQSEWETYRRLLQNMAIVDANQNATTPLRIEAVLEEARRVNQWK